MYMYVYNTTFMEFQLYQTYPSMAISGHVVAGNMEAASFCFDLLLRSDMGYDQFCEKHGYICEILCWEQAVSHLNLFKVIESLDIETRGVHVRVDSLREYWCN